MEMEVVVRVAPMDFNFDCSSPYITAPSSPQQFGNFYFSTPTNPTRASAFYCELNNLSPQRDTQKLNLLDPLNWEERLGISKSTATKNSESDNDNDDGEDFEFNLISGHLDRTSLSDDELFDGGKIKPLKPPPQLQVGTRANDHLVSISSPRSQDQEFHRERGWSKKHYHCVARKVLIHLLRQ